MNTNIRIGVCDNKLAQWQGEYTQQQLKAIGIDSSLVIIKGQDNPAQHTSTGKKAGVGFIIDEVEEALLADTIDLAAHDMKALPTRSTEGLSITALSCREAPSDWLAIHKDVLDEGSLLKLRKAAIVGVSSACRQAQLLGFRPDIEVRNIQGDILERLNQLRQKHFEAIMLSAAALIRLNIDVSEFGIVKFNPKEFIPAPAQGVMAWQARTDDKRTRRALKLLHHEEVSAATNVERRVLNLLDGDSQMALGVYCERDAQGNYHVWAAKADAWNAPVKKVRLSQSTNHLLAERVVEALVG